MKIFRLFVIAAFASSLYADPLFFSSLNGVVTTTPVLPYFDRHNAVNDLGQFLVDTYASGLIYIAQGDSRQYIPIGGGYPYVYANGTALNNSGQVVGRDLSNLTSWFYSNGQLNSVVVPGSNETDLFGLSSNGVAIGNFSDGTGYYPFTYSSNNRVILLDRSLGSVKSINASGVIIGNSEASNPYSYIYDHGAFTYLTPPGATNSFAVSIADSGLVAGTYLDNATRAHSFFYENGVYTSADFGLTRPGFDDSVSIISMSSNGQNFIGYANPAVPAVIPEPGSFSLGLCAMLVLLGWMIKAKRNFGSAGA